MLIKFPSCQTTSLDVFNGGKDYLVIFPDESEMNPTFRHINTKVTLTDEEFSKFTHEKCATGTDVTIINVLYIKGIS